MKNRTLNEQLDALAALCESMAPGERFAAFVHTSDEAAFRAVVAERGTRYHVQNWIGKMPPPEEVAEVVDVCLPVRETREHTITVFFSRPATPGERDAHDRGEVIA